MTFDVQKFVDVISAAGRRERSNYHLTLGEAIEWFSKQPATLPIITNALFAPGDVASYRGYYSDLAFDPTTDPRNVGIVLANLTDALNATFEGYKGGDYVMSENTPLWISGWGDCSNIAVMGLTVSDGVALMLTKRIED